MRLSFIALPLVALCPLPAMAQNQSTSPLALPAGCTAYLTVQKKSCSLSHHFTCEGDAEGLQRRVDMGPDGVTYFGVIDAETQWIESSHMFTGHSERLEDSPADRASFTDLTTNGSDSYDFQTLSEEIGTTRYVGQDRLTGETVTIDGVTLEVTDYNITAFDSGGGMIWQSEGQEYISREWRMFLSGQGTVTTPEDEFDSDDAPMEFIFPGEPGFLSSSPKYGCGSIMSSLSSDLTIQPARMEVTP
jgi:hypothetical protein